MRHSFTYMKLRMISRANVLIFLEKASLNVIEFLFYLSKITDYYDKIFIINDLKAQNITNYSRYQTSFFNTLAANKIYLL